MIMGLMGQLHIYTIICKYRCIYIYCIYIYIYLFKHFLKNALLDHITFNVESIEPNALSGESLSAENVGGTGGLARCFGDSRWVQYK
jgi:hypothetical protein